jgi:hypothetical protein
MRYLKYVALLAVLMVPLAYSQAQVSVGVGIGVGPGYVVPRPPVCAYGYYDYYPYACAPYGFYGPSYFVDGVFIGAGPWYHWGHPAGFWNRGWRDRDDWGWRNRGFYGRGYARGYVRGYDHAYNRGYARGEFHGGNRYRGGNGFRGGQSFHGGGEFHGGGGFHGGRR